MYDGDWYDAPLLTRFTGCDVFRRERRETGEGDEDGDGGEDMRLVIRSSGRSMFVVWTSDEGGVTPGFECFAESFSDSHSEGITSYCVCTLHIIYCIVDCCRTVGVTPLIIFDLRFRVAFIRSIMPYSFKNLLFIIS